MRTCTSVSPIDNGFGCNGNGTETVQCQNRECSGEDMQKLVTSLSQKIDKLEHAQGQIQTEVLQNLTNKLNESNVSVGFAVDNPDTSSGYPLKFKDVIYNTGDNYNVSSGVFTCRHPGLYFFTATFFRSPGVYESGCSFSINGINKLVVNSGTNVNDGYQSGSGSLVYHLKAGDIVVLSDCFGQNHMYKFSSFTGFRVSY
ncbi:C1q-related factor-like isoform X2 [Ruditapes philippinarum]|nr:C1q-related factor-like isoform X2 [Ruditapes philippinarum]